MIPIHDENPTSRFAIVTALLIAVNIGVFLTEPIFAGGRTAREQAVRQLTYFECHAAVPYELTHGRTLFDAADHGAALTSQEQQVFAAVEQLRCANKNVWLSLLESMFLHEGFLHIGFNMLFLWIFGNNVEDRLGWIRYIVFYLLCGVAAAYAQSLVFSSSAVPLIGASGAIAGVLGAYLLMFPRARIVTLIFFFFITWIVVPAWVMIGLWFLLQLLSSVGSVSSNTGVAYMAHVGGFIAGMLLLFVFRPRRRDPTPVAYPY